MIEVHDLQSLLRHPSLREAMHELRYRQFYEKQSWDVPAVKGVEIDQYDRLNADPVYLLALNDLGRPIGTCRLLRTEGPYMVRDHFAHMMGGRTPPSSPEIWEANRIAVDVSSENGGIAGALRITGLLLAAICEYCLPKGVHHTIGAYEPQMLRLLKSRGATPDWVGETYDYPDSRFSVAMHPISWEIYDAGMALNGFTGPVIAKDFTQKDRVAA
ncbi:MAG: hypothetical protein Tsb008_21090 [Rhodothalassiaceae bacterium]